MGLFSGRDNTADRAAEAQRQALEKSQRQIEQGFGEAGDIARGGQAQSREDFLRQRGQNEAGFDPFIQAGQGALEDVIRGSTGAGRAENLEQIIGSDIFQVLRDEQERAARGQFSASGQTGSGNALQFISQISPQLALQLEREQFDRQQGLAGQGFQGVSQRGQLGNQLTLGQGQLGFDFSNLQSQLRERLGLAQGGISQQLGQTESQRIIGDAASRAKRRSNIFGTAGSLLFGQDIGDITKTF